MEAAEALQVGDFTNVRFAYHSNWRDSDIREEPFKCNDGYYGSWKKDKKEMHGLGYQYFEGNSDGGPNGSQCSAPSAYWQAFINGDLVWKHEINLY